MIPPKAARWIFIALGVVALVSLAMAVKSCSGAQRRAAEAQAGQVRAEGQVKAATDATGLTANAMEAAAESKDLGRESEDVIRKAPGADAPVDPALATAARRRLCLRPANVRKSSCVALLKDDPRPAPR
jgi:hypothetical protein